LDALNGPMRDIPAVRSKTNILSVTANLKSLIGRNMKDRAARRINGKPARKSENRGFCFVLGWMPNPSTAISGVTKMGIGVG